MATTQGARPAASGAADGNKAGGNRQPAAKGAAAGRRSESKPTGRTTPRKSPPASGRPSKDDGARRSKDAAPAAAAAETSSAKPERKLPRRILAIDIGGTNVKLLASGESEPRRLETGRKFTPADLVEAVKHLAHDWRFDAISIGYPGQVGLHGPRSEPLNLGAGWVGFDFAVALEKPVRFLNDAAMQALGSYESGRMLFLGLGTGLGSTLITENVIVPLELGQLRWGTKTLGERVGRAGLERDGKRAWRKVVCEMVERLTHAFVVDHVVLGGGNAKLLKELPPNTRLGHNLTAFRGGFRLWHIEDVPTIAANGEPLKVLDPAADWKVI